MCRALIYMLILSTLLFLGLLSVYTMDAQDIEIDVCVDIYRVIDGDTFDAFPLGRIRLADIDAPELGTPEGEIAKQTLSNLVSKYGPKAYLDVDDLYVMDRYNRVVAIAYLRYNKTHVLNINKWLIDNGYATISDYSNEFNPYTWSLYVYQPHDPCGEKTITTTIMNTYTIKATITTSVTVPITTTVTTSNPITVIIIQTTTVKAIATTKETVTETVSSGSTSSELLMTLMILLLLILMLSLSLRLRLLSRKAKQRPRTL